MKDKITDNIEEFECPKCGDYIYMHYGGFGAYSGSCNNCLLIFHAEPESFRVKITERD